MIIAPVQGALDGAMAKRDQVERSDRMRLEWQRSEAKKHAIGRPVARQGATEWSVSALISGAIGGKRCDVRQHPAVLRRVVRRIAV